MENVTDYASESERLRARHRAYYLGIAETAAPHLLGPHAARYHAALAADHENIRSATHRFARAASEAQTAEQCTEFLASGARLCVALTEFWSVRGFYGEGRDFCEQFLQQDKAILENDAKLPPGLRAQLLRVCAHVWGYLGNYPPVIAHLEEALELDRAAQNDSGISEALTCLGVIVKHQGRDAEARALFDESLMYARRSGDNRLVSLALFNIGEMLPVGEEKAGYYEEALAVSRETGDVRNVALALGALAWLRQLQGDEKTALLLYDECRTIRENLGDRHGLAWMMRGMAQSALAQGDRQKAIRCYNDAIDIFRAIGNHEGIAWMQHGRGTLPFIDGIWPDGDEENALTALRDALKNFVPTKEPTGIRFGIEAIAFRLALLDPKKAVVLWGSGHAIRLELNQPLKSEYPLVETIQADVKAKIGDAAWDAAFARGHALSMDEAVALALHEKPAVRL